MRKAFVNRSFVSGIGAALVLATVLVGAHTSPADAATPFLIQWGSMGSGPGEFNGPRGAAVDSAGNVYVADSSNHRVQKFTATGGFVTQWGTMGAGPGQFNTPFDVAIDAADNVYVLDTLNNRVQKFTALGTFVAQWGTAGSSPGQFFSPRGITTDGDGNVYVADTFNARIQRFTATGGFLTQWGTSGEGPGQFDTPADVATDADGNVYVSDSGAGNERIQKFTATGTFIKQWGSAGSGPGQFNNPAGVATDTAGNVYVTELDSDRVQKFTGAGTFLTTWGTGGSAPGQFDTPFGVAIDGAGNVYVADTFNHRVQKFAQLASITVVQDSVPNDAQDFDYSLGSSTFVLDDDADPVRANTRTFTFPSVAGGGVHTITQTAVPGWELNGLACDTGETVLPGFATAIVDLGPNEDVTCTFTSTKDTQPDGEIKNKSESSYLGLGIINTTGVGQTKSQTKGPGKFARFNVRVHNDSAVTDVITLAGPASPAGFKVKYFKGQADITSQVTSGSYSLGTLAPGATGQVRVEVKVTGSAVGSTDVLVTATSSNPVRQDAVKATVTAG